MTEAGAWAAIFCTLIISITAYNMWSLWLEHRRKRKAP